VHVLHAVVPGSVRWMARMWWIETRRWSEAGSFAWRTRFLVRPTSPPRIKPLAHRLPRTRTPLATPSSRVKVIGVPVRRERGALLRTVRGARALWLLPAPQVPRRLAIPARPRRFHAPPPLPLTILVPGVANLSTQCAIPVLDATHRILPPLAPGVPPAAISALHRTSALVRSVTAPSQEAIPLRKYQPSSVSKRGTLSSLDETGWDGTLGWLPRTGSGAAMAAEERLCRMEEEGRALGEEERCSAQEANDEMSADFMSAELAAASGWPPARPGRGPAAGCSARVAANVRGGTGWSKTCPELGEVPGEYQPAP